MSSPPLYSALAHSPLVTGRQRRIYYEVLVVARPGGGGGGGRNDSHEVSLAMGIAAPPYPPFRLPGWHRGSLAVHGDDGRRYVADDEGGVAFVRPFERGSTYGLGMVFSAGRKHAGSIDVEVVFTKNGALAGRWDLHEETDAENSTSAGVVGLAGYHDLCAAVGVFDRVEFEVILDPEQWQYAGMK